jgi:hypothetical protein
MVEQAGCGSGQIVFVNKTLQHGRPCCKRHHEVIIMIL